MKQSVSPCETHSISKLIFFETKFGDFLPYFGSCFSSFWLLAVGYWLPAEAVLSVQKAKSQQPK